MIEKLVEVNTVLFLNILWGVLLTANIAWMFYWKRPTHGGFADDWHLPFCFLCFNIGLGVAIWVVTLVEFV